MIVAGSERVICFDVDDTLIIWDNFSFNLLGKIRYGHVEITCPHDGARTRHRAHQRHIKFLKRIKAKGFTVVVWSQSGTAWAEAAVLALGLEDYVDIVMSKPEKCVDDLPNASDIIGKVFFLDENGHSI